MGVGRMCGVLILLGASRYALTVQAPWLVLRTSPIHGSGLPSNPGRGRGWSCYIPFLLLHTSPIKISSCCTGPLACFNYLSCPCGVDYHPIHQGERGWGWSCNVHSMVLHVSPLLCRPISLF